MCNEVQWLQRDILLFGHVANHTAQEYSFSAGDERAAQRLRQMIVEALEEK